MKPVRIVTGKNLLCIIERIKIPTGIPVNVLAKTGYGIDHSRRVPPGPLWELELTNAENLLQKTGNERDVHITDI